MLQWEGPLFEQPFELWRDEGVLHLVLADGAQLSAREVKEVVRLVAALDRDGRSPLMIDHAPNVAVADGARRLITRVCKAHGHPVVVYTASIRCQGQLELFRQVHKPSFPFKVCSSREEAWAWASERRQREAIGRSESLHRPEAPRQ